MRSSYKEEDVVLLLKDITGLVKPQPADERERLIQSGKHYSEMLPAEYVPTAEYMQIYHNSLKQYAGTVASAITCLAAKIIETRGKDIVLVSLARAGIPAGILLKRYLKLKYQLEIPHYSISIIRGRGIDSNAMAYLLKRYKPGQLLFIDGWTGKGAIYNELEKEIKNYKRVFPGLAVIADPANITNLCGTHEDILIPSSCLNCTVSGLISRTLLRSGIIGRNDFHGAIYYKELESQDLSYNFIETVEKEFNTGHCIKEKAVPGKGLDEVKEIAACFGINDINLVKPGIGEATRVLLRRIPWKVLISREYKDEPMLCHLARLAEEKNVPVLYYPLKHYKCCGIIKKLADT